MSCIFHNFNERRSIVKRNISIFSLILLVNIFPLFLFAQNYKIQKGDELFIAVVSDGNDGVEFTAKVSSNGNIILYQMLVSASTKNNGATEATQRVFDIISVEGKTITEIKDTLFVLYSRIMKTPKVTISLVRSSLIIKLKFNNRVYSKDFIPNKTYKWYIEKWDNIIIPYKDSILVDRKGQLLKLSIEDIPYPNDIIMMNRDLIYVTGEVRYPRYYYYNASLTIYDYIGMSGGVSHFGNLKGVKIYDVNGKKKSPKDTLKPGDTIYIPPNMVYLAKDIGTILSLLLSAVLLYNGISSIGN